MRWHTLVATLFAGLTLALVGCTGTTNTSSGTAATATSPTAPPDATVELKTVTGAEWDKVIQQHKGKVVVVDVWATWCEPCRKKFPDFLALSKKYPKEDLVCISLTVDEKDAHAAALKLLQGWSAAVPNYRYEDTKEWQDQFNLKGLPVAYVYGRDGKLARTFDINVKEFTYDDVGAEVKTQVEKK